MYTALLLLVCFYVLMLFEVSRDYEELLRRGRIGFGNAVLVLVMFSFTLALVFSTPSIANIPIYAIIIGAVVFFIVVNWMPGNNVELIATKRIVLDGEEVEYHVYTGEEVTASWSEDGFYVHEVLERVLSKDELCAVLFHEYAHSMQESNRYYSTLRELCLRASTFWAFMGFAFLVTIVYTLIYGASSGSLAMLLESVETAMVLYLISATATLSATYPLWIWEQEADLYATSRAGAEVYARALVKANIVSYLEGEARYAQLERLDVTLNLGNVQPLRLRDIAVELAKYTLTLRGIADIVATIALAHLTIHPPLHLRLWAIATQTPKH